MVLLDVLFAQHQAGLVNRRRDFVAALALHLGKQLGNIVQICLGEVAGHGHHRVLRPVVAVHIVVHGFRVDGLQGFGRTEDRAAERRAFVAFFKQLVDRHVLRGVLVHVDLFEHHAALELDVLLRKAGVHEHIRQNGDAGLQTLVQHLHIIAGAFLVGESVRLAAECVDRNSDMLGGALFRALEDHVLDKV